LRGRNLPYHRIIALQRGGVLLDDGALRHFWGTPMQVAEIYALASEKMEQYRGLPDLDPPRALTPGSRRAPEWANDLRHLLSRGHGGAFRSAAISRDDLWRVARSVRADLPLRAAAAVALSVEAEALDGEQWTKLAEDTASPELRQLFEHVAREAGEDELATALDRVAAAGRR
jgi:hypothetical protein